MCLGIDDPVETEIGDRGPCGDRNCGFAQPWPWSQRQDSHSVHILDPKSSEQQHPQLLSSTLSWGHQWPSFLFKKDIDVKRLLCHYLHLASLPLHALFSMVGGTEREAVSSFQLEETHLQRK